MNFKKCRACGATVPEGKYCDQCGTAFASEQKIGHSGTGKGNVIRLKQIEGRAMLVLRPDTILGRVEGDYTDTLGQFDCVSGTHARVTCNNGRWMIEDLDSSNGTYVNDDCLVPFKPHEFRSGDVIDLGTYLFEVL